MNINSAYKTGTNATTPETTGQDEQIIIQILAKIFSQEGGFLSFLRKATFNSVTYHNLFSGNSFRLQSSYYANIRSGFD
jgi:hypothetical protein